ncbi:hypothetical protein HU751_025590 [Pseudomonas sp. BW13M1]|uniref:Uncharacterized protein n=1 Tax=Pseudomonas peradeniyensis TaxID=2745488 RepID=A0A923GAB9_9PSED|nr:hypothetical protein [Pseudomonas peradeniyensis]MBV4508212.1 hypothetical protein [Pseudomonas peradeniyensis]
MISVSELNELLIANNCLHSMSMQFDENAMVYDLSLLIAASEKAGTDAVRISFIDVSQLTSRDFGGGLTQLMHMSVSKLDSGLDRIRYQFCDHEDGKLSFCFSSFSVDYVV